MVATYKLPLGTKLRKEIAFFNTHGITRDLELDYNICWFLVASFALHPDIVETKSRKADAIKLFF
jgi:hypothetical protein